MYWPPAENMKTRASPLISLLIKGSNDKQELMMEIDKIWPKFNKICKFRYRHTGCFLKETEPRTWNTTCGTAVDRGVEEYHLEYSPRQSNEKLTQNYNDDNSVTLPTLYPSTVAAGRAPPQPLHTTPSCGSPSSLVTLMTNPRISASLPICQSPTFNN